MGYKLKNGESIVIREPMVEDAYRLLELLDETSTETKFLARNPGEVWDLTSISEEEKAIERAITNPYTRWYVVEYNGEIVGQGTVEAARMCARENHRGYLGLYLVERACNKGIGGKLMSCLLEACKEMNMTQAELSVVCDNFRALNMYLSFGFEICGRKPRALRYLDGSYSDEYCMIKYFDK